MKTIFNPKPLRLVLLMFFAQLLVACVPGQSFFNSGIAREWGRDNPVSREQLIMEPLYYFSQLDQDLDRSSWLLIPQGKLLQTTRLRHELTAIRDLLGSYTDTLQQLPGGEQLPEHELASIYLGIFDDLSMYLDNETTMQDIETNLLTHETRIRQLEHALENAAERRLKILVQTLSFADET